MTDYISKSIGQHSLDAAIRYAAFDRTDPFAMRRAIAHMKNGVAGALQYNASEQEVTREKQSMNGKTLRYKAIEYHSVSRP